MNALTKISNFFMTPAMKIVMIVAALLFPFVAGNEYQIYVMALAFVWAIAVYGMNIITGLCGQLNLAHGGFFAIGAYTLAILTVDNGWAFWPAFIAAGAVGAILGFLVGVISLRLKEHYFAIFTLCVGFIIYLLLDKWEELTHGALGIINIPAPSGFGLVDFTETTPFYYLALAFMVLSIWLASRIAHSLLGRTFLAIRISDDLAASLGINLMRNKVLAFVLSTTYASVAFHRPGGSRGDTHLRHDYLPVGRRHRHPDGPAAGHPGDYLADPVTAVPGRVPDDRVRADAGGAGDLLPERGSGFLPVLARSSPCGGARCQPNEREGGQQCVVQQALGSIHAGGR